MRDWPEFGSDESKKQLTAKEVLQHRSGLQWFSTPASYDMMIPAGIKAGKMAKIFEEET